MAAIPSRLVSSVNRAFDEDSLLLFERRVAARSPLSLKSIKGRSDCRLLVCIPSRLRIKDNAVSLTRRAENPRCLGIVARLPMFAH
jgi:hypothetical protein